MNDDGISDVEDLGVELCWANVEALADVGEDQIWSMMSPGERERCQRFRHQPSRRCYLMTRYLVRSTLSKLGGRAPGDWEFGEGDQGRPFLKNPTPEIDFIDFNIAHSNHRVVLAVIDGGRVGVDLEPAMRRVDHEVVAKRFFHRRERQDLKKIGDAQRHRRFLELWVLKEAWLKADGRGISAGLNHVVFRFDSAGTPRLSELPDGDAEDWKVQVHQFGDHLLGLAVTS